MLLGFYTCMGSSVPANYEAPPFPIPHSGSSKDDENQISHAGEKSLGQILGIEIKKITSAILY